MSDLENRFSKAFEDGVIDKKDVSNLFNSLTVEDWQVLAKNHKTGDELFAQRKPEEDILGLRRLSKFGIHEKEDEFVIQNDKGIVDGKLTWQGAKNFLGTSAIGAVGFFAARRMYGTPIGLATLGVIAAGGMIKNYFDTRDLKQLAKDDYLVKIPKTSLASSPEQYVRTGG